MIVRGYMIVCIGVKSAKSLNHLKSDVRADYENPFNLNATSFIDLAWLSFRKP